MLAKVNTCAVIGLDGANIEVEVDIFPGLPAFTIDATDDVVCPGFIDTHAHSGLGILSEPRHESKVRQGVTTELIGVDGNPYVPFRFGEDFLSFVELCINI